MTGEMLPHIKIAENAIESRKWPKQFDGKSYYFFENYESKTVAEVVVSRLRKFGYNARLHKLFAGHFVNKSGYVYSVYVRRKK